LSPNENAIPCEDPDRPLADRAGADGRSPDSRLTTPDAAELDRVASLAATRAGGRARRLQRLGLTGLETVRPTALRPGAGGPLRRVGGRPRRFAGREGLDDPPAGERA